MGKQYKRERYDIHGWINLDKPYDMTSTQAVGAIKRLLSPKKVGHAGTLDPLATGVLPLALGDATKTVQYMMDAKKAYRFTVTFGMQTDTDDIEGVAIKTSSVMPSNLEIEAILPQFIGHIQQLPPAYSALKINGERAYDLARSGEEVVLQPRNVDVYDFKFLNRLNDTSVELEVVCGKGTYVRSLARDIGLALGSCAHVSQLQRTRVGSFLLEDAITLDNFDQSDIQVNLSNKERFCHPIERALDDIPAVLLDHTQSQQLRHGQSCFVSPGAFAHGDVESEESALYKALCGNQLVALVQRNSRNIAPVRVFNH